MKDATTSPLPVGTVTFAFTDIEGSTRLLEALGDDFTALLEAHNQLLRQAFVGRQGTEVRTEGDAFFFVFPSAWDAVAAAADGQRALAGHSWPPGSEIRVRMGLHTGLGVVGGGDYVGLDVHRAARIAATGHGGQILISESTAALIGRTPPEGTHLRDMGKHRLKDLTEREALFQLDVEGLAAEFPPLRTLEATPNNLPLQPTSFVGREAVLAEAVDLLSRTRLLTLTGPGGTGKTRLSLQVAAEVADDYPDGVFFVDLSVVSDPELVPRKTLTALGVSAVAGSKPPEDRLIEELADKSLLLVLDNFEQLLDAAPVVGRLLKSVPAGKFLVTSRAPLSLSGEQEMPVPPLQITTDAPRPSVRDLMNIEAVHLFVERAVMVRPGFELTDENAGAVAEIVERLDGLPLAIELVASRVKLLGPEAILERLDYRALGTVKRDLPERQQTIWGAIDWSYQLLDDQERRLFATLSVFMGGGRLEEIEEVCAHESSRGVDLLTVLASLVDHSLVRRVEIAGKVRFGMLHVIREYASDRLDHLETSSVIRKRHAEVYTEFAEEAAPRLTKSDRNEWLNLMDSEHDNVRAALRWAVDAGQADIAMRLVFAVWRFWQARGHLHEAKNRVMEVLGLNGGEPRLRAKALEACGGIDWWRGDSASSLEAYQAALEIQREVGDPPEIANALYNTALALGFVEVDVNADTSRTPELFDEAERIYTELDDGGGLANIYWGRATLEVYFGEGVGPKSIGFLEKSAQLYREAGNEFGLGWALFELGESYRRLGELDRAWALEREGLALFGAHDDVSAGVLFLIYMASIARDRGDEDLALRLAGASHNLRIKSGTDLAVATPNTIEGLEFETLEGLSGPKARAYAEGKAFTLAEAVAYALGS